MAGRAEIEKRVAEVVQLLLERKNRTEIVTFCAENWGIEARQADEYISRAEKRVTAANGEALFFRVGKEILYRESLYAQAMDAQDYRLALAVRQDIAKMAGLYATNETLAAAVQLYQIFAVNFLENFGDNIAKKEETTPFEAIQHAKRAAESAWGNVFRLKNSKKIDNSSEPETNNSKEKE